jgi:hypothetical protein
MALSKLKPHRITKITAARIENMISPSEGNEVFLCIWPH